MGITVVLLTTIGYVCCTELPVAWMITAGGCVTADWFALATAPDGFSVPP